MVDDDGKSRLFQVKPEDVLVESINLDVQKISPNLPQISLRYFPPELLNFLSSQRSEIIFGDVLTPQSPMDFLKNQLGEGISGGVAALASFLYPKKFPRRELIKGILAGYSAWATFPLPLAIVGAFKLQHEDDRTAANRILLRLHGILSNFHPEQGLIFFRNLLTADKLLTVGHQMHLEKGKKPAIAYVVGGGHAGIEDMLQVGQEVVRTLICLHPADWLRECARLNNTVDELCSARLMTLPANFASTKSYQDIRQRLITDAALAQALKEKLQR